MAMLHRPACDDLVGHGKDIEGDDSQTITHVRFLCCQCKCRVWRSALSDLAPEFLLAGVGAGATVKNINTVSTKEAIDAVLAEDIVIATEAIEFTVAVSAKDSVIPGEGNEGVIAEPAPDIVGAVTAVDGVVALTSEEDIAIAWPTKDDVGPGSAIGEVVAVALIEIDGIIATTSADAIDSSEVVDNVLAIVADDHIIAIYPCDVAGVVVDGRRKVEAGWRFVLPPLPHVLLVFPLSFHVDE
jgi:hypothetical protein